MNAKMLYLQSYLYPYSSALATVLAHTIFVYDLLFSNPPPLALQHLYVAHCRNLLQILWNFIAPFFLVMEIIAKVVETLHAKFYDNTSVTLV